ncbi:hypothetical protein HCU74_08240 [Spongiibacter sp. KMU-166]|uniref:Uncharacterized protein n=1 Tax=Spongiibacter thalassae TaxID=2721624 RepID=A0ABX1GDY9_9GAMM|nr:hypothetical protein [Spongiibacter thalassae]NKI17404.1 hypothetical protein [Spongiibacter thalassae]
MKSQAKSPREHAHRLREQWKDSHRRHPTPDGQRRIDWLIVLMMGIAAIACFAVAWRIL